MFLVTTPVTTIRFTGTRTTQPRRTLSTTLFRNTWPEHVCCSNCDAVQEPIRWLAAEAHAECGLSVVRAEYLGAVNWGVINFDGRSDRWWYGAAVRLASWSSKIVWLAERAGLPEITNAVTSPYVVCVARRA